MMIRPKNVNIPNFKYDGFQTFIWIWWSIWIDGFDKRLSQEQHNIHFPSLAELLTSCARRTLQTRACTRLHAAQRAAGSRAHSGIWEGCSIINYHPYLGWFILDTSSEYTLRHYLTVSCHTTFSCARVPPIPESCTHCRKVAASPAPASTNTTPAQCIICSFIHFQFSSCCHLVVISPRPSEV